MEDQKQQTNLPEESPGYETRDAALRGVIYFAIGLTALVIVVFIVAALLFNIFDVLQVRSSPPPPPLLQEANPLPPAPRLQRVPGDDLVKMRAANDALLNSYGWVDKEAGIVRIPIDRAMELTLERGLPARPQTDEAQK